MFKYLGKMDMVHVPYKGGAAVIIDALAGNIQVGFGTFLSLRPHFNAGKLRPLAITDNKRTPIAPELPTVAEAGIPGYEVDQRYGIVVGAKVPRPIVNKLSAAVAEAVKSPEVAKRLSGQGVHAGGQHAGRVRHAHPYGSGQVAQAGEGRRARAAPVGYAFRIVATLVLRKLRANPGLKHGSANSRIQSRQ